MKSGIRKGKLMSQCMECLRTSKGRDPVSGMVPVERVEFVFMELERRIGRTETCRRLGVSFNFWYRMENRTYVNMRRTTARKAMILLQELRNDDVVLHKHTIKHGSIARGHRVRRAVHRRDYNIQVFADETIARRRSERVETPEQKAKWAANRYAKKLAAKQALKPTGRPEVHGI